MLCKNRPNAIARLNLPTIIFRWLCSVPRVRNIYHPTHTLTKSGVLEKSLFGGYFMSSGHFLVLVLAERYGGLATILMGRLKRTQLGVINARNFYEGAA